MKKIFLGVLSLLLISGCTLKLNIEEQAHLVVAVHNQAYGDYLKQLWNETYEQSDVLEIVVLEENEILTKAMNEESIGYDLYFVEDKVVPLVLPQLYEMPSSFEDSLEVSVNREFSEIINRVANVYFPLTANGMFYAINTTHAKKENIDLAVFDSFETLSEIDKAMYVFSNAVYMLPLLTTSSSYFPGKNATTLDLKSNSFKLALQNYLQIKELVDVDQESIYFDQWFLNEVSLSGLIGPWMQADVFESMNKAVYQYQKLPTINGDQPHTIASSSGYVINKNTLYPQAAMMCLQLMHSIRGVQILCGYDINPGIDSTKEDLPLILETEMSNFKYFRNHLEEKIRALNYALQDNLVALENKPEVGAIDFLSESETIDYINACSLEESDACIAGLVTLYEAWIKK